MTFTQLHNAAQAHNAALPTWPAARPRTPADIRRHKTMHALRNDDAQARWERGRRRAAREAGYRGPLTREEASRRTLAALAARRAG